MAIVVKDRKFAKELTAPPIVEAEVGALSEAGENELTSKKFESIYRLVASLISRVSSMDAMITSKRDVTMTVHRDEKGAIDTIDMGVSTAKVHRDKSGKIESVTFENK